MQNQFNAGDKVKFTSGPYGGYVGIVRKVHNFGLGRKPFEVERPDGSATDRYDHGELAPFSDTETATEPGYGHPR